MVDNLGTLKWILIVETLTGILKMVLTIRKDGNRASIPKMFSPVFFPDISFIYGTLICVCAYFRMFYWRWDAIKYFGHLKWLEKLTRNTQNIRYFVFFPPNFQKFPHASSSCVKHNRFCIFFLDPRSSSNSYISLFRSSHYIH